MRAGELRHRVTIQKPVEAKDPETGENVINWETHQVAWAKVEAVSGKEDYGADRRVAEGTHLVTTRYVSGVTAKMRVKLADERVLQIVAPPRNELERDRMLVLDCEERPDG